MRLFDQNRQERTFQVQQSKAAASGGGYLLQPTDGLCPSP
jgi:hypothetical protein